MIPANGQSQWWSLQGVLPRLTKETKYVLQVRFKNCRKARLLQEPSDVPRNPLIWTHSLAVRTFAKGLPPAACCYIENCRINRSLCLFQACKKGSMLLLREQSLLGASNPFWMVKEPRVNYSSGSAQEKLRHIRTPGHPTHSMQGAALP